MAYCQTTDLLTGDVPTPAYLSPQKYVDDAANEIDSKIGFVYETPVDITDDPDNPVVRPVRLLLTRLNVFIATGRLLMAVAASGEDERLHAYGWSLVQEATLTLEAIASGKLPLEGVDKLPAAQAQITAPLSYNEDSESNVSAFYDRIVNPNFNMTGYLR